jgi:hypothetical protein
MRIKDDAKVAKMTFAKVEPDDDGQATEAEFGEGTQGIENVHEGVDGQATDGQATEAEAPSGSFEE